jgi:hypothetical protein
MEGSMTKARLLLPGFLGMALAMTGVNVASASLVQLPAVQITADGSVIPVDVEPVLGTDGLWRLDFRYDSADFGLQVSFTGDPDPSIQFTTMITDIGAPNTFSVMVTLPILLPAGVNEVASSLSGTLTDATGDGVSATGLSLISSVLPPETNLGVDLSGSCLVAGVCGPFSAGPIPGPPGPWVNLRTTFEVTMSGGGDQSEFNALASINLVDRVPEPATPLLLTVGLALAAWRRRRAR